MRWIIMKREVILSFLVTSFILVVVVLPLQYQDKGSIYEPTGQHGGM